MNRQWPILSYESGKATYETLQLWTQIVGKIKLATMPWANHSWNVTLHITSSGLTTQTMPYEGKHFQIDFDFHSHELVITTDQHQLERFYLGGLSVSGFYNQVFEALTGMGIQLSINKLPCEIMGKLTPFDQDHQHRSYEKDQAAAFHQALLRIQDVFLIFRSAFSGKASPVHFFWGGFDLALAFFSGRNAPRHPGKVPGMPDWVLQDAYNREVSDCGFFTGSETLPEAAFYCYLYPEPLGYKEAEVEPSQAYYNQNMGEFILPYSAVQKSEDPDTELLIFLKSTYEIGSRLAGWENGLWNYDAKPVAVVQA